MKILIVEDNKELNNAISTGLKSKGYSVDAEFDGKDGLRKALNQVYDLIILDINLPSMNGIDIARNIREESTVPLLALTAKDSIDDKVTGFSIGFDDYLTKPFEFAELIVRIEALIRRSKPNISPVLSTGNVVLDLEKRIVTIEGKEITLSKIEFNLLEYLLRKKGIVVTNTEIIEHVWYEEPDLNDPPIRSHIKNIRKKIGDKDFQIIKTISGIGYKIE